MKSKPTQIQQKTINEFIRLLEIMDTLRANCPWDKKQTFTSLRTLTIEETYELADSILSNNMTDIKKELGDLLLHIVFYAKIASEKKSFTLYDVLVSINQKLKYRHPHIFGNIKVKDAEEVKNNWEKLKMKETDRSVLGGVPKALPALAKANRIQQKARGVGFDWEKREQVFDKIQEELNELIIEARKKDNLRNIESEFGDLLFSVVNAARLYDIDPENALEITNRKFIKRFTYLEKMTIKKGKNLKDMSLAEMEKIWQKAKKYDD